MSENDQGVYVAHLETANRNLRQDLDQAHHLRAASDRVIGRQAAQLEQQARTIRDLRERIGAALDVAADTDGPACCEECRVTAITDALGAFDG